MDNEEENPTGDVLRFADWLENLSHRMKDNPEEFIQVELEWLPDPINIYLFDRKPSLDLAGYFIINIQKVSHK